jgi:hypothetical protein
MQHEQPESKPKPRRIRISAEEDFRLAIESGIDGLELSGRRSQWDSFDLCPVKRDHLPPIPFVSSRDRMKAESRCEDSIESGWCATSLNVTKD